MKRRVPPLALLYDVHGNLPALQAVLADAWDAGADRFLLGSAAEVAEQLAEVNRRIGCNYMLVGVHLPGMPNGMAIEQMQILAEEVFPAVRQAVS